MKELKTELKTEIKILNLIEKQYEVIIKSLNKKISKQILKRDEYIKKSLIYHDEDEIQDAFGYGYITEKEKTDYLKILQGLTIERVETSEEIALEHFKAEKYKIYIEKSSLEFEMLPEDEKQRRIERGEKIKADILARKRKI